VRRGFKQEAKRLALEVRAEMGLAAKDLLSPEVLADLYGIPVYDIADLIDQGCSREAIAHFEGTRQVAFSAALIPIKNQRIIVENSAHTATRRRASIAHEMAHVILEHEFGDALLNSEGCRSYDKEAEEEADRLGGELLIPYETALLAARMNLTNQEVADQYKVSLSFAAMRMNASGARIVVQRQRSFAHKRVSF
jgi:Zn-dependent peptidase ImmA (M78 family)